MIKHLLNKILEEEKLNAFFITNSSNISYITSYNSRDAYLLVTLKNRYYITDGRYIEEARDKLSGFKIIQIEKSVVQTVADICCQEKVKKVGFEEKSISFVQFNKLKSGLGKRVSLIGTSGLIESLRLKKTKEEVAKIKKATEITIQAFNFTKRLVKAGISELELVGEIQRFIRYQGAFNTSFDVIVAGGLNSSYPHHSPSLRRVKKDDLVLVDMGVDYCGYKSDLTRVFFSGKINFLAKKIYEIVLSAQEKAINSIASGKMICDIDFIARDFIASKGYGKNFPHSLGHGIGLQVHELPNIYKTVEAKLEPGMVFTVEPAIYLPGKFGIRIEDLVLVTEKGCEVISGALNK